jgi:predicted aminopeptidase
MESRTGTYIAPGGQAKRGFGVRVARVACFATLLTILSGCRAGYVAKVGIEHLRFMSRAVPISEAIEEAEDPQRKELLALVLDVREFAAAQGLDVGGSYAKVADTTGLTRAWVVTAAYQDRLEAYEWRYPVVGRIPYRGYFDVEKAERFAGTLDADELDTYIVEASGYSTLGWFDDPLPSGLLDAGKVELASTVIHELVHQTLFVRDAIAFNETLASVIESRLAIDFFEGRGDEEAVDAARRRRSRWLEQCSFSDELAADLEELLADRESIPRDRLMTVRGDLYETASGRMRDLGMLRSPPEGVSRRLNNALFLALYRYRKKCQAIDDFFDTFDSVRAGLTELEARLGEADDPYAALSR